LFLNFVFRSPKSDQEHVNKGANKGRDDVAVHYV